MTDSKPPIQEAQRTPNMTTTKSTPRHITCRLQKTEDQEKILREARQGRNTLPTYIGIRLGITVDFSSQTIQARREKSEMFSVERKILTTYNSVYIEIIFQK